MAEGREFIRALDRIGAAIEKLADPVEHPEIPELGPPVCPHCGIFDPEFEPEGLAEGAHGPLSTYYFHGVCGNCGNRIYGVAQGYSMHPTFDSLKGEILERQRMVQDMKRKGGFTRAEVG